MKTRNVDLVFQHRQYSIYMSLVLFVLKSFLGIARQRNREKFVIFAWEPYKNFNISDVGPFYLVYKSKMAATILVPKARRFWDENGRLHEH